jgi:MFS family permease
MDRVALGEWRRHWPLVLAASLGYAVVAIPTMTLGAFMAPLEAAFGWSRAQLTAGLIVQALVGIATQPLVGRMIDRWGPRRIGLTGLVLCGCAFALFSTMDGSVAMWLLLWVLVALAVQLILSPTWTAAVSSEFEAGRGLAIAITLSGGAIVTLTAPVLAALLIEQQGWRAAYVMLGLVPAVLVLVLCYFCFFSRKDRQRISKDPAAVVPDAGLSAGEGLRSPVLYKLIGATIIGNPMVIGIMIHVIPITSTTGLTVKQAALVAGSLGLSSVLGKILMGLLIKRVPGHVLAAANMALPIAGALMLMQPSDSLTLRIVAITFFGVSSGAQTALAIYLASRHFGLRAFGTLVSLIAMTFTITTGVGPFLAGHLFDIAGDYHLLLLATIPASILASLILLWVGRYPEDAKIATSPAGLARTEGA